MRLAHWFSVRQIKRYANRSAQPCSICPCNRTKTVSIDVGRFCSLGSLPKVELNA
jgi:hypothetical protein